jgi:hypothetical protein
MRRLRPILVVLAFLAIVPAAWAATNPPVKGANYEGTTTREATTIANGKTVRGKATILLKVSRNGRSVKVLVPALPSSCTATGQGALEKTSSARISRTGVFKGTMTYVGVFEPAVNAKASFRGRFNGRHVTGTLHAEFLKVTGCNGSSAFTALAPAPKKHK